MTNRYYAMSDYLKEQFGCSVYKVSINAGFTCPNRDGVKGLSGCVYCEPLTVIPKDYKEGATVTEQLNRGIKKLKRGADKFIAYFQVNTSTYAGIGRLEALYKEALKHPEVAGLAISTRPDCVSPGVMRLLREIKKEKPLWLELGLQSANDSTLRLINRGHTVEDFEKAFLMAAESGINVCAHVIFGLPGETRSDMLSTVKFISRLNVWGVKFHQLEVIKGTRLEEIYKRDGFILLGLEEYVEIVLESLEMLSPDTVVHRLSAVTPKEFLIAPLWGLNRFAVKTMVMKLLESRDTRQGAKFEAIKKPEAVCQTRE